MKKALLSAMIIASLLFLTSCSKVCDYDSETKTYVGKSVSECARIKFLCAPGTTYFEDGCGCGCILEDKKACPADAKICPDGTSVGRIGPDCEFEKCPESKPCVCPSGYILEGSVCNPQCYYNTPKCLTPSIECSELDATRCADPRPEACTLEYNPVCGYSEQQVQCIRAPCPPLITKKTYGNACAACADKDVDYWTKGECGE